MNDRLYEEYNPSDPVAWQLGYFAGLENKMAWLPDADWDIDRLSWYSGYITGQVESCFRSNT